MEPYQNFIEESPSVRISGCRYKDIGTDYIFKIKRKKGNTLYMSCVENGCTAKLVVKLTGKTRKSFHNHKIFIKKNHWNLGTVAKEKLLKPFSDFGKFMT